MGPATTVRTEVARPSAAPAVAPVPGAFAHEPALDGLRAVAVGAVLAYHAGFGWAPGGFLGVDLFMVLSGYLITRLLLAEHAARATIGLRAFWGRRFRRLLPALFLLLAGVVVFDLLVASPAQRQVIPGDLWATLAYGANWKFVAAGQGYFDQFTDPSPLRTMWSLAVEEQFYLLWPLLVVAVLRLRPGPGRGARAVAVVAGVGALASAWWMRVLFDPADPSRAYYGTDTRAQAFLVGALLAAVLHERVVPAGARRVAAAASGVALVALAWLIGTVSDQSAALFGGGFLLVALLAALVIGGSSSGPVATALSWRPLQLVGLVSYGLYLWHWPVFLWLTPVRTGLGPLPLAALRLTVTGALTVASFFLVEQPIRRRRRLGGSAFLPAVATAAIVLAVSVLVVDHAPPPTEALAAGTGDITVDLTSAAGGHRPTVALFGDATAAPLDTALVASAPVAGGRLAPVRGRTLGACPIGRSGAMVAAGGAVDVDLSCNWTASWAGIAAAGAPDLALVSGGTWDAVDRMIPGDTVWRHPGDPTYDAWLVGELVAATDLLAAHGSTVVWVTLPVRGAAPATAPGADPARRSRVNELLEQAHRRRPDTSELLDLGAELDRGAPGDRPDGVQLTDPAARAIVDGWLGERLVEVAARHPHAAGAADRPPTGIAIFGDSVAATVAGGFDAGVSAQHRVSVTNHGQVSCLLASGERRREGRVDAEPGLCDDWRTAWARAVAQERPDLAVAVFGPWEILDHRVGDRWLAWGSPEYDEVFDRVLADLTTSLGSSGARVVFVTLPYLHQRNGPVATEEWQPDQAWRVDHFNDRLRAHVAAHPDVTALVDLASFVCPSGPDCPDRINGVLVRPDGIHYSTWQDVPAYKGGDVLVASWLAPRLRDLAARADTRPAPAPAGR